MAGSIHESFTSIIVGDCVAVPVHFVTNRLRRVPSPYSAGHAKGRSSVDDGGRLKRGTQSSVIHDVRPGDDDGCGSPHRIWNRHRPELWDGPGDQRRSDGSEVSPCNTTSDTEQMRRPTAARRCRRERRRQRHGRCHKLLSTSVKVAAPTFSPPAPPATRAVSAPCHRRPRWRFCQPQILPSGAPVVELEVGGRSARTMAIGNAQHVTDHPAAAGAAPPFAGRALFVSLAWSSGCSRSAFFRFVVLKNGLGGGPLITHRTTSRL